MNILSQRAFTVLCNAFPDDINNDDLSLYSGYITIIGNLSMLIPYSISSLNTFEFFVTVLRKRTMFLEQFNLSLNLGFSVLS